MHLSYDGINTATQGLCRLLLEKGCKRGTRGSVCYELPEPVLIELNDPTARWCTIKERNWLVTLPVMEFLQITRGRNDIEISTAYVKNLENYSDDGLYQRGGYGPRFRFYSGINNQHKIGKESRDFISDIVVSEVDQFKFIIELFKRDPYTRQAVMQIADPAKDCFDENNNLIETKDTVCNRSLMYTQDVDGTFRATTTNRSNDVCWGLNAVNIPLFTMYQEIFAHLVGIPIGKYFHLSNNLHFYDYSFDMVKEIAEAPDYKDEGYKYKFNFSTLKEFDNLLKILEMYEEHLRNGSKNWRNLKIEDPFFNDILNVFKFKWNECVETSLSFNNPVLESIIFEKIRQRSQ